MPPWGPVENPVAEIGQKNTTPNPPKRISDPWQVGGGKAEGGGGG